MKNPYYSKSELIQIAESCNTIVELSTAGQAIKYLYETCNENIFLSGFQILAHYKIRQLLINKNNPDNTI
jgi:hypothetical protein